MEELIKMIDGLKEYILSGECNTTYQLLRGSEKVGTEFGPGLRANGNVAFLFLVSKDQVVKLPPKIKEEILVFLSEPDSYV